MCVFKAKALSMEFDFSIEHILGEKLAVLSSEELKRSRFSSQIEQMIDKLGQASAEVFKRK